MNSDVGLVVLCVVVLCVGVLIGVVLQKEYDADKLSFLTNQTQEQFWTMQGLEQKVRQYESNPCSDVIIQTQFIEKVNQ